jgi:hypothetical protein
MMLITDTLGGILASLLRMSAPQTQKVTQSTTGDGGASATQTSSSSSSLSTSSPLTERDYTHMTPREMNDIAQELYDSGKIDLTQLLMLQTAGMPLGKRGPDGEYVPLSTTERSGYQNTPVNYLQISQDAINSIQKSGGAADPKSGYTQWTGILAALRQSSPSIDLHA